MRFPPVSGLLTVIGLAVLAAGTPAAQAPAVQLSTVKSLSCLFPVSVAATFDGAPNVTVKKTSVLTFKVDQINIGESSARFVGPTAAPEHIVAQLSGSNLHLMDLRASGSLAITTVFPQINREGKLKAVYSRTDYLPITLPGFATQPEISQRYGECEVGS